MTRNPPRSAKSNAGDRKGVSENASGDALSGRIGLFGRAIRPARSTTRGSEAEIAWKVAFGCFSLTGGKPNGECRFIQENKQESSSVNCNADVYERSAGLPAHSEFSSSEPTGPEDCLEKKHEAENEAHKTQFVARLTPERIFSLASEEMQALISDCCGTARQIRELHVIDAATRILPVLGINHSAWIIAVQTMGDVGASLCVLLLDANRTHPTAPVRNPGGALRAMTNRYQAGKLNLVGSLIGLSRRRGL